MSATDIFMESLWSNKSSKEVIDECLEEIRKENNEKYVDEDTARETAISACNDALKDIGMMMSQLKKEA